MSATFTRERVLQMAPDPASAKAGQDLASPRKWKTLGGDGVALWGECQGSGSKPYQVQIELAEPAFKCSCPSRKFPCKHGLGLLLMFVSTPELLTQIDRPAWVAEWLAGRAGRAEKKEQKAKELAETPPDPEAIAERQAKRLKQIKAGLADLRTWTEDVARGGLASMAGKDYAFFETPARRLVDAKAPGAARLVRDLAGLPATGVGWQRRMVEQLGSLYLLVRAAERYDHLPVPTRADVLQRLGVPVGQEELALIPPTADVWQVLAQRVEVEDNLRSQRTWLIGTNTRRVALVLNFAHGTTPLDTSLTAGTEFDGTLTFYPGTGPRAALMKRGDVRPIARLVGHATIADAVAAYGESAGRLPWLDELALPLRGVAPTRSDGRWSLTDAAGSAIPTRGDEMASWTLAAISGGRPVDVVGEYDGRSVRLLSAWDGGLMSLVSTQVTEAA